MEESPEVEETQLCNNCKRPISVKNFELHYLHCKKNLKVCKKCKEPVLMSEKEKHLENYHTSIDCKFCGDPHEKWKMPKHQEVCPKRLVPCPHCGAGISHDEFPEHENFCGSRTERCFKCHQRIMKRDYNAHLESHNQQFQENKDNEMKEVSQNELNEKISRSTSIQNRPEKVPASKDRKVSFENNRMPVAKDHSENSMPEGAVALAPDKKKKVNKKYHHCVICQENIALEDVATHIPMCANAFGKCAICLKSVPPDEMNSHMYSDECRRYFEDHKLGGNEYENFEAAYNMQIAEQLQNMEPCPYCQQMCTLERITIHVASCPENKSARSQHSHRETEMGQAKHEAAQSNITDLQSMELCPHCHEMYSLEQIADHVASCPENKLVRSRYSRGETEMSRGKYEAAQNYTSQSTFPVIPYQCPLCNEEMPEDKKKMHESFYCKVLLDLNQPNSLYSVPDPNISNKSSEKDEGFQDCLCCGEKFSVRKLPDHVERCLRNRRPCKHCDELILSSRESSHLKNCSKSKRPKGAGSYAQATKNPAYKDKEMASCYMCKENVPFRELPEHQKTCTTKKKTSCVYCDKEMFRGTEDIHLKYCPAFNTEKNVNNGVASKYAHKNKFEVTGAVPKHLSVLERGLPRMEKCRHCNTTYNADILVFHESECGHQKIECPDCYSAFPLKDVEEHRCKRRGKGKRGKGYHQKNDGNSYTSGLFSSALSFFTGKTETEPPKSYDVYQNDKNQMFESSMSQGGYPYGNFQQDRNHASHVDRGGYHSSGSWQQRDYRENEQLYFSAPAMDDAKIPCEFCNKSFPASEIVLHETGCKPEEVSFAKPVSARQEEKTSPLKNEQVARQDFFFVDERRFIPSTKYETVKKHITSVDTKPGQFLNVLSRPSETSVSPIHEPESVGKKTAPRKLQAVWNNDSSESEAEDMESSETQREDGPEKMLQDAHESEKEPSEDVEMHSVESDEEVSSMMALINKDHTKLCELMEKLDGSKEGRVDDLNTRVDRNLSSSEFFSSGDDEVPVPRNNKTLEDKSVQPKKTLVSCSSDSDSDVSEAAEQQARRFKYGGYRTEHPDEEEKNAKDIAKHKSHVSKLDEEVFPASRNNEALEEKSDPPKKSYVGGSEFTEGSEEIVSAVSEATKQQMRRFRFGSYRIEHPEEEEKNTEEIPKYKSNTSTLAKENVVSNKTVDSSGLEKMPFQKAYNYILNASVDNPDPDSDPESDKAPVPKSGGRDENVRLHEKYSYRSQEIETSESELKVDTEELSRKVLLLCDFCKEEVEMKEYDNHVDFCGSLTVKCVVCKKYIKRKDRKAHAQIHLDEKMQQDIKKKESCTQKQETSEQETHENLVLIKCRFCGVEVPLKDFIVHTDICGSSGFQCQICKKYIKNRDRKLHSQMHTDEKERQKKESAKQDLVKKQDIGEVSKHYTKCNICHQIVPWIDYNIHVPNCAADAGKCSRCGDVVSNSDLKEHVLKTCRMIKQSKPERNEMLEHIERGKHFYERAVKSMNPERVPQRNPRDVPTSRPASHKSKSMEGQNPAFTLEPAENNSHPYIFRGSRRDMENNSLVERKSQESNLTTAENVEKWAKWSRQN